MNKETGATAIVPGSHRKVQEINASRARKFSGTGPDRKWIGEGTPGEDLESFTEHGLTPGVVNAKGGDLILFDTALYESKPPSLSSGWCCCCSLLVASVSVRLSD